MQRDIGYAQFEIPKAFLLFAVGKNDRFNNFGARIVGFVIFFIIQVPLSIWWLGRYAMGPMEWLWRYLTYGHAPAMARAAVARGAP